MSRLTQLLLTTGLSAVIGGLTLNAQVLKGEAKVPFSFHAQGRELAAGSYRISELSSPGLFQLRGSDASIFVNAGLPGSEPVKEGKLVFTCYGHDCVLSEIALSGAQHSQRISPAAIEKNLNRKIGLATMISVPLRAH